MYFPYFRGRQYELIALRELAEKGRICNNIFPIIEPVSISSTLKTTLDQLTANGIKVGLIINPKVASLSIDIKNDENINKLYSSSIPTILVDGFVSKNVVEVSKTLGKKINDIIFVFNKKDYIDSYIKAVNNVKAMYNVMPDEGTFRRAIRDNRVVIRDSMNLQDKNVMYPDEEEFFSDDHLYFNEDGYIGFSDYSTIGDRFVDGGFRPYCVVIHIVYLSKDNKLMIKHFKSDSNEGTEDVAGKFYEALKKFIEWNKTHKLATYAEEEFQRIYDEGSYPGLGVIKKLSIMNHLEIISRFLKNEN